MHWTVSELRKVEAMLMAEEHGRYRVVELVFLTLILISGTSSQAAPLLDLTLISKDTSVGAEKTLLLVCAGFGQPHVNITWSRDDQVTSNSSRVSKYEEDLFQSSRHFKQSFLQLCSLEISDSGSYTCTISNGLSSINSTIELSVIGSGGGGEHNGIVGVAAGVAAFIIAICSFITLFNMFGIHFELCRKPSPITTSRSPSRRNLPRCIPTDDLNMERPSTPKEAASNGDLNIVSRSPSRRNLPRCIPTDDLNTERPSTPKEAASSGPETCSLPMLTSALHMGETPLRNSL